MRDFKLRAIEAKYIMYFQEVMRVLYDESKKPNFEKPDEPTPPPITCCPDIRKLIYKINLKNWKTAKLESFVGKRLKSEKRRPPSQIPHSVESSRST